MTDRKTYTFEELQAELADLDPTLVLEQSASGTYKLLGVGDEVKWFYRSDEVMRWIDADRALAGTEF